MSCCFGAEFDCTLRRMQVGSLGAVNSNTEINSDFYSPSLRQQFIYSLLFHEFAHVNGAAIGLFNFQLNIMQVTGYIHGTVHATQVCN